MLPGWKTLDTQNNSLNTELLEDKDLDNHSRDCYTDTIMILKQMIYWLNFVTREEYI